MSKGLITVVVPIYNTEKYLDRCVSSIVNQTYTNLEIILIDDGSPDRCPELCEEWARRDTRIQVIHKTNAGLGMARNTGIDAASGEYICFFDSDDYIDLNLIEKAYHLANDHAADLVTFGFTYVDEKGEIIGTGVPRNALEGVSSCTRLFSLRLFRENDIRYPSERELISEDFYAKLFWEVCVKNPVCLSEPLYFYCRNFNSLTRSFRKDKYEKGVHFYISCLELVKQQGRYEEKKEEIKEWFIANAIASMKQALETDQLTAGEKWTVICTIVTDLHLQRVIAERKTGMDSLSRRLLFVCVSRKAVAAVFALVWLQTKKKKKWR